MAEASLFLKAFTDNPYYTYFKEDLARQANVAFKDILEGNFPKEGQQGILMREQSIGAASAWLRFEELVLLEQQTLADLTKQNETND